MKLARWFSAVIVLGLSPIAAEAQNNDEKWWFDIELIMFDRNTPIDQLQEQFEQQNSLSSAKFDWDLLSRYYQPDISFIRQALPSCDAKPSPIYYDTPSIDDILQARAEYLATVTPQDSDDVDPNNYDTSNLLESDNLASDIIEPGDEINSLQQPQPEIEVEPVMFSALESIQQWLFFHSINQDSPAQTITSFNPECLNHNDTWMVYRDGQIKRYSPTLHGVYPERTPVVVSGTDWQRAPTAHLLSEESFELEKLSTQLRWRKGLTRLLHMAWRQQVKFGEDNAEVLRVFAGDNYANAFTQTGEEIVETPYPLVTQSNDLAANDTTVQDGFFHQLDNALLSPTPISFATMTAPKESTADNIETSGDTKQIPPIWQVDGGIQIFLKYLNSVPYLHINGDFHYRVPVTTTSSVDGTQSTELISIPFRQLRRVISTQVHYFDHPLFGFVIQIRRYDRPAAPTEDKE